MQANPNKCQAIAAGERTHEKLHLSSLDQLILNVMRLSNYWVLI